MLVSKGSSDQDKGRLFGKKPGLLSMRARGLYIERQMDFVVCTRYPEELKSQNAQKRCLTRVI